MRLNRQLSTSLEYLGKAHCEAFVPKLLLHQVCSALACIFIFSISASAQSGSISLTNSAMQTARSGHTATLLNNGNVLLAGGAGANAQVESFNLSSASFQVVGSLSIGRTNHTAILMAQGRLLITGGTDGNGTTLASAEIYDPTTGISGTTTNGLLSPRSNHRATLLASGKILLTGGLDENGVPLATAEIYDPSSGVFTATGTMQIGRAQHTAALLNSGKVLIAGGTDLSTHTVYDVGGYPHTTIWTEGEPSAEIYDPSTGLFTPTGSMQVGRWNHSANLLSGAKVLILAGGQQSELHGFSFGGTEYGVWNVTADAELYDPISGVFLPAGVLNSGRAAHTATLLTNGQLFVAGGETLGRFAGSPYNTTELYDPNTAIASTGPALSVARSHHTATRLLNGAVLLTGGGDATAELYWPNGIAATVGYLRVASLSLAWGYNWNGYVGGPCNADWHTPGVVFSNDFYISRIDIPNHNNGYGGKLYIYEDSPTNLYATSSSANVNFGDGIAQFFFSNPLIRAGHTYFFDGDHKEPPGGNFSTGGYFNCGPSVWNFYSVPASNVVPPPSVAYGSSGSSQSGSFSDPVNTATGNYVFQRADFSIPGRGLPLVFTRTYNSTDPYSGVLGAGWTHSYNVILTENPEGSVTIKQGDGHDEFYDPTGGGNFTPRFGGVFNVLIKNLDGSFTLTLKNQSQYGFSTSGKLGSITNRNGNALAFAYNGSGDLIAITDTVSRIVTLAYDASHRITLITDSIGRTVQYGYDTGGNLASVTDQNSGIMTFAYDASHRVTEIIDERGTCLLVNTYDAAGRVADQTNGRNFTSTFAYGTPQPGDTTIIDPRGNTTIHTHDAQFRLIQVTDADGNTMGFTYDAQNNRTSVTNQNGKMTSFTYDSQGNITGIADPLTNSVALTYDVKNNLLGATNARGNTTTFSYDAVGNLETVLDALGNSTIFVYDGLGQLTSKTDARGNATTFSYDALGNLTRITDALGKSSNLSYDSIGRLLSMSDANGHAAAANYDALSRLVKITDPLGNQTQFAYDAVGDLLKITDAKGNATNYAYDAVSNLESVTDALSKVTRYAYDENNNRVNFTNAKGNITSYAYDPLNRLVQITDPLSFATSYTYDAVGNVLTTTDANGRTNQFTYDALNRLTEISYADGNSVTYSYDENGNRAAMVDSHGTTSYIYDAIDRLTSVNNPGSNVVAYAYDAVGNRKSMTYPDGKVVNYTYDQTNRLSQAKDWLARTTSYTYDPVNNLTKTLYPNGASIAFSYDVANHLTKVVNASSKLPALTLAYTLDKVGNRTKLSVNGLATTFGYDAVNQLVSAQLGSLKSTWTYDSVGDRLKQTSPIGTTMYSYDAADRLLSAGPTTFTYDSNGNQITKATNSGTLTYSYDAANRLTRALGPSVNSSFSYDGDGNRILQSRASGTYNYINDVARALPVVLNEQGPDGNITYAYGLGLIEAFSPSFNYFYHYDGLGSVVALTDAAGKPSAAYAYDPWGNPLINVPDSVGTKNKFRFTGEALDPGTGLYYLRARYYDSITSRFLTRDPFSGIPAFPLSKNRYTYALANPISYRDPSGLFVLFGIEFFEAVDAADRAHSTNLEFSRLCYMGDIETCTPEIQQQRQRDTKVAIREIGDVAAAAPGVIYNPALIGLPKSEGAKLVQRVIEAPAKLSWIYSKWQEIFGVDPAFAPGSCSATPADCVNSLALSPPTTKTNESPQK